MDLVKNLSTKSHFNFVTVNRVKPVSFQFLYPLNLQIKGHKWCKTLKWKMFVNFKINNIRGK